MKITMNDIIAFVDNAMSRNLDIRTIYRDYGSIEEYVLHIYKQDDESELDIQYVKNKGTKDKNSESSFSISTNYLNWIELENISELDIANFKVLVLKAKEYSDNRVLNYFWNFFKEDEKPPTINDLDNEDD